MTTVHLIYPHGRSISCPDAIGRNLGHVLGQWFNVCQYDWMDTRVLQPAPGDVLLGHPHNAPWTIFRRSVRRYGWHRRLLLAPFNCELKQVAFMDSVVRRCDLYLAITGNYWFDQAQSSDVSHWLPKMRHVDLAVDRQDFPQIKADFNEQGRRRFLYIGNDNWAKNVAYLEALAEALPEYDFGWVGDCAKQQSQLTCLGWLDFGDAQSQRLVAGFDFLITVGSADANPATILEAMAWGLIPICTPQSGYQNMEGIINVPLNDLPGAVQVLRRLQEVPRQDLVKLAAGNRRRLDMHFNWQRFGEQVRKAIQSDSSPPLGTRSVQHGLLLRREAVRSPYSMCRPSQLVRFWGSRAKAHAVQCTRG